MPFRKYFSVFLALSLLSTSAAYTPLAVAKADKTPLSRNFLPPVAIINGKINPAEVNQLPEAESLEPVALSAITTPVLTTRSRVEKLADNLNIKSQDDIQNQLSQLQHLQEENDLQRLWSATVDKSPIIRFSLEKVMMPSELAPKNSRQFSKYVSALISGAAIGSSMLLGGGGYQQMGIMSAGNAIDNVIQNRLNSGNPTLSGLSPTEQIQLAGLIDELKDKLLTNYHNYKQNLVLLANARRVTLNNNNLLTQALQSKEPLTIMAAESAYQKALLNETILRQKTKAQRIHLERLAGAEAVSQLSLALHDISVESNDAQQVNNPDTGFTGLTSAQNAVVAAKQNQHQTKNNEPKAKAKPKQQPIQEPHPDAAADTAFGPEAPVTKKASKRVSKKVKPVATPKQDQPIAPSDTKADEQSTSMVYQNGFQPIAYMMTADPVPGQTNTHFIQPAALPDVPIPAPFSDEVVLEPSPVPLMPLH